MFKSADSTSSKVQGPQFGQYFISKKLTGEQQAALRSLEKDDKMLLHSEGIHLSFKPPSKLDQIRQVFTHNTQGTKSSSIDRFSNLLRVIRGHSFNFIKMTAVDENQRELTQLGDCTDFVSYPKSDSPQQMQKNLKDGIKKFACDLLIQKFHRLG